ncbi:MAG: hypothetical protein EOO97_00030 [Pedobacter sp.]|nr:MAG: hypothetical protein EOO97_00030 [Pedobacter sp.]
MIAYCKYILKGIGHFLVSSYDLLIKGLLALVLYFQGIHIYLMLVGALVLIDVTTGLYASLKRGEGFSSRKLRKGLLEKLALYLVLMVAVCLTEKLTMTVLGFKTFYLTWLVSTLICFYECSSVAENLVSIRPDIPFLSGLVKIFNRMGQKTLENMNQKVNEATGAIVDFKANSEPMKEQSGEEPSTTTEGQEGA